MHPISISPYFTCLNTFSKATLARWTAVTTWLTQQTFFPQRLRIRALGEGVGCGSSETMIVSVPAESGFGCLDEVFPN